MLPSIQTGDHDMTEDFEINELSDDEIDVVAGGEGAGFDPFGRPNG